MVGGSSQDCAPPKIPPDVKSRLRSAPQGPRQRERLRVAPLGGDGEVGATHARGRTAEAGMRDLRSERARNRESNARSGCNGYRSSDRDKRQNSISPWAPRDSQLI